MSEAREVIARELADGFRDYVGPTIEDDWLVDADDILSDLTAAGLVVLERERFERLQDASAAAKEFTDTLFLLSGGKQESVLAVAKELGVRIAEAVLALQPGDLDPLREVE